jgi:hypothetical protein
MANAINERRQANRRDSWQADVWCKSQENMEKFELVNLSVTGALLRGEAAMEPGTKVRIRIDLPGCKQRSFRAEIVRTEFKQTGEVDVALAFRNLDANQEDTIQDLVTARWIQQSKSTILIASSVSRERSELLQSMESIGYFASWASTPLEAIALLDEPDSRIDTIVIGPMLGQVQGLAFAKFIAISYPGLRRVLLVNEPQRSLLQSDSLAHILVTQPWSSELLEQVVH